MPIETMTIAELKAHRTNELEGTQKRAAQHLKSRGAALAKDGSAHPQMLALEQHIIAVTLLMVTKTVAKPLDGLSITELLSLRTNELEPMVLATSSYLSSRNALPAPNGSIRPELTALDHRIVECTLAMMDRAVAIPIAGRRLEELLTIRSDELEPVEKNAIDYLAQRNEGGVGDDGKPTHSHPQLRWMMTVSFTALEARIVEVTPLRASLRAPLLPLCPPTLSALAAYLSHKVHLCCRPMPHAQRNH